MNNKTTTIIVIGKEHIVKYAEYITLEEATTQLGLKEIMKRINYFEYQKARNSKYQQVINGK